jgi:short-subunit dehydrogenase
MDLTGAVVVVTGASAGIGRVTALAFAGHGSTVVATARREARLADLVAEIEAAGGHGLGVRCDVTDLAQVQDLVNTVRDAYGRCDVLVNNAGIPGGGPFAELSMHQIERVTRTNYLGVLYCSKTFLPLMLDQGRGHIVNVASMAGRFAVPGASVYAATKHAVVAFSEALYFELKPRGIIVTVVNPGIVSTEGFPHADARDRRIGRPMRPERVAEAIVDVVRRGKAPELSVPRWMAAMQAARVLVPPLYRFGLDRVTRRSLRPTPVKES